uniref:Thrombomodulin n=1 Tax=Erpetoichthys calabaricus TaxID=27687 RepID=A0A8C4SZS1_ERPCA
CHTGTALLALFVALTGFSSQAAAQPPKAGLCNLDECYAIHRGAADFETASDVCRSRGGHLMTVRSTVHSDIISILKENLQGRLWIGLELPAGRCSDPSKALRGYRWVTGEEATDFTQWSAQDSSECGRRCVSISIGQLWEESSCLEAADGFLCEYNFNETCQAPELKGISLTYRTPFGFQTTETTRLPPGTIATVSSSGVKRYCGIDGTWALGPWDCQSENGGCSHKCEMERTKAKCFCPEGLQLEENQVTCETPDPCRDHPCEHLCLPQMDRYLCTCREGYRLGDDGSTCLDVDECQLARVCEAGQVCANTPGSFQCACPAGYRMVSGRSGCPPGFEMVNGMCEDRDECEAAPCEHECANTPGSFDCYCLEGFQGYVLDNEGTNQVCVDIDECDSGTFCEQLCDNSFGSYTCHCKGGYELQDDGYSCTPFNVTSVTPVEPVTPTANVTVIEPSAMLPGVLLGVLICVLAIVILVCAVHINGSLTAFYVIASSVRCKLLLSTLIIIIQILELLNYFALFVYILVVFYIYVCTEGAAFNLIVHVYSDNKRHSILFYSILNSIINL